MDKDRQVWLLEELQKSLRRQAELARLGKVAEVEALALQTRGIIEEIGSAGLFRLAQYRQQLDVVQGLYRDLRLILGNQMDEIRRELSRIRKGRQAVGVYRESIRIKEG